MVRTLFRRRGCCFIKGSRDFITAKNSDPQNGSSLLHANDSFSYVWKYFSFGSKPTGRYHPPPQNVSRNLRDSSSARSKLQFSFFSSNISRRPYAPAWRARVHNHGCDYEPVSWDKYAVTVLLRGVEGGVPIRWSETRGEGLGLVKRAFPDFHPRSYRHL